MFTDYVRLYVERGRGERKREKKREREKEGGGRRRKRKEEAYIVYLSLLVCNLMYDASVDRR